MISMDELSERMRWTTRLSVPVNFRAGVVIATFLAPSRMVPRGLARYGSFRGQPSARGYGSVGPFVLVLAGRSGAVESSSFGLRRKIASEVGTPYWSERSAGTTPGALRRSRGTPRGPR